MSEIVGRLQVFQERALLLFSILLGRQKLLFIFDAKKRNFSISWNVRDTESHCNPGGSTRHRAIISTWNFDKRLLRNRIWHSAGISVVKCDNLKPPVNYWSLREVYSPTKIIDLSPSLLYRWMIQWFSCDINRRDGVRGSGREKKRDERLQKWARKNRGGNVCKEVGRRASNKITDYDINECRDGTQRVCRACHGYTDNSV